MARKKKAKPRSEDQEQQGSTPKEGGVQAGGSIRAGGDIVGRDKAGRDIAGRDILTQSTSSSELQEMLERWRSEMEGLIETQTRLSEDEKKDLKEQVAKIQGEASKGAQADPDRLEKLVNTLAVMAPDIFEVAVTTLANPLAGIGLVAKKIGDKARLETKTA